MNNPRFDIELSLHEIGIILRSLELERNSLSTRASTLGNVAAMISEIDSIVDIFRIHIESTKGKQGVPKALSNNLKSNNLKFIDCSKE